MKRQTTVAGRQAGRRTGGYLTCSFMNNYELINIAGIAASAEVASLALGDGVAHVIPAIQNAACKQQQQS